MPLNKSWHDYNKSLIERGCIRMDISFLQSTKRDIENIALSVGDLKQDNDDNGDGNKPLTLIVDALILLVFP